MVYILYKLNEMLKRNEIELKSTTKKNAHANFYCQIKLMNLYGLNEK